MVEKPAVMYLMPMPILNEGAFTAAQTTTPIVAVSVLPVSGSPDFGVQPSMVRRALSLVTAFLAFTLVLTESAFAWGSDNAGLAAMPSVAQNPAARPGGLAGAYTALGEGPSAIGINPAALARDSNMVFHGAVRPDLSRTGAVALAFPATGGQWALSATYVDYDEILATDENQNATDVVKPFNVYPAVSYARRLGRTLRVGATLKLAHETLGDFEGATSAWGAGLDAGLQVQATRNLGFGLSLTNLGRQFSGYFEGDQHRGDLPASIRAGVFYQPRAQRQLVLVAEAETPMHSSPSLTLGGEYTLRPEWIVRGGTRWTVEDVRNIFGTIDPNAGIVERGGEAVKLAGGTTVRVGPVSVDYAAQWWRELGVVHALSVGWSVGG